MAQHDLSDLVQRIDAIGGDLAELLALTDVEDLNARYKGDPEVIAWNVRAASAAYELVDRMETAAKAPEVPQVPGALLATPKQVDYASRLLAQKAADGDTSGFVRFSSGTPTRDQLAAMTRRSISTLIDSLTSRY